jgi:aspartate aminotransferase
VGQLAVERGFWIVSDECYEALTYEGRHVSIASLSPEIKARTLVVNTCSKAYAMTGWRLGYAAGPKFIIKAMTDIQSQVTSNPTSIAQWAAVEALAGPQDEVAKMAGEFDRRRRVIVEALNAIPSIRCVMPKGAFYVFPNISGLFGKRWKGGTLKGSADVCAFLLEEALIATVAGVDFGSDAHIRLSYATGLETIKEGMSRMAAAVRALEG